jgi:subtilisin family serine protease
MRKLMKTLVLIGIFNFGIFAQPIAMRVIDGKNAGLVLQRVPEVWAEGYFGQGVLIASIDEDFEWDHPDIVNQIWNNLGEDSDGDGRTIELVNGRWELDPGDLTGLDDDNNGYIDDLIGWDFVESDNDVRRGDATSHGTAVAGIIAGDGTLGIKTGIAPQCKLMLLRIGTNSEQEQYYAWEAMQYCIDMNVQVITQSQSFHWDDTWCDENGQNCGPPDVAKFRQMAELELEAGIIHFSSVGNDGQLVNTSGLEIPFNISIPGNCPPPWLHPEQTLTGGLSSIMAIGNVNAWNPNVIHQTSPYGPSSQEDYTWYYSDAHPMPVKYQDYPYNDGNMGLLKPDLTAYGAATETIEGKYPNFVYDVLGGTSSATPHAAGVAVLLLSVDPTLTPSDICRILKLTSVDNGTTGHDNRYGAGTVDAYEAYLEVIGNLPVELSSFTATVKDYSVILDWRTETEVNNFGFEIERKVARENNWELIGFVEGNGSRNAPIDYSFVDKNINKRGVFLYRLKQIDTDGSYVYSGEVSVTIDLPVAFTLNQNYPNPFNPSTNISFSLPEDSRVRISVYNLLGEQVTELVNDDFNSGRHTIPFDANSITSGVYLYKMETNNFISTRKMIIMR